MTGLFYGGERQHPADLLTDIALRPSFISNVFRSTDIKYKKNSLFFLLPECFHKSAMAFGTYVPVDGSDIVAILIGPHIIELKTRPFEDRMEVALHLAVDRLAYLYLILPQLL